MEVLIGTAMFVSVTAGFILGMGWAGRLVERECEMAYLTGHVDGYAKAEEDSR